MLRDASLIPIELRDDKIHGRRARQFMPLVNAGLAIVKGMAIKICEGDMFAIFAAAQPFQDKGVVAKDNEIGRAHV